MQSNEQQYVTRVDWNISAKHTLYGRYFYDDYELAAFFNPTDVLVTTSPGNSERAQSIVFGDTYSVSPSIVNSFHFTFSRRRDNRGPNNTGINANTLGVKNIYQGTANFLQLSISNGGFSVGSGSGALGSFNINSYQEADDVDVIKGKHQMAFGVDIIRTHDNQNNHYEDNGSFQFNGMYSKDPLLDFLTGYMNKFEQTLPQQNAIRQTVIGLYAQDTWHATPKLVVNAGLRWEPTLFPQDYFGRGSTFSRANFDAGTKSQVFTNAPAGQLFYGDPGVPKAFTGGHPHQLLAASGHRVQPRRRRQDHVPPRWRAALRFSRDLYHLPGHREQPTLWRHHHAWQRALLLQQSLRELSRRQSLPASIHSHKNRRLSNQRFAGHPAQPDQANLSFHLQRQHPAPVQPRLGVLDELPRQQGIAPLDRQRNQPGRLHSGHLDRCRQLRRAHRVTRRRQALLLHRQYRRPPHPVSRQPSAGAPSIPRR